MRVIQLSGVDGDHLGLYTTDRTDKVDNDFKEAFDEAKELGELDFDLDVHEAADEILRQRGIERIFADQVYTTVL